MSSGRVAILSERKLGFHSKSNTAILFQKTHTTHEALSFSMSSLAPPVTMLAPPATPCGFACNCLLLPLRYRTAAASTPPPRLKKMWVSPHAGRAMKTSSHFVCKAGQPSLHFASLSWEGLCRADPLCHPYHIFL